MLWSIREHLMKTKNLHCYSCGNDSVSLKVEPSKPGEKPSCRYTRICNVCKKGNESTFAAGEPTAHVPISNSIYSITESRNLTPEEFKEINEIFKKLGGRKEIIPNPNLDDNK